MTTPPAPRLDEVLAVLSAHGHDFREYAIEVLRARLADHLLDRREPDLAAYVARLSEDAGERARLVQTLATSTSGFFRYVELFHVLREQVIGQLGARGGTVRAWVAGVATGEEAWSLAMLLAEARARGGPPWEIVASDLNPRALAIAARGRYPLDAATDIPADLRAEYTRTVDGALEPDPALRPHVRFEQHDLLGPSLAPAAAVLARFDLVLCCNVLIYLARHLQVRLVDRLLAVLAPEGALALGPHERPPAELSWRLRPRRGLAQPVQLFERGDDP